MTLCVGFVLSPLFAQQAPPPAKALTPEQQAYRQWDAKYRSLQDQGKQVFAAEMAREKAGDCPNAQSDSDFNVCFGKQLTITGENLTIYEKIIRELMAPPPQAPGQPAAGTDLPVHGIAGPSLSSARLSAEFERVEQAWRQYSKVACAAAFHQFDGGTGGPGFELQCELQLTRDHMRELHMIYGESFL